jgi:hypothetical protein
MERAIRSLTWKRPTADVPTDITNAIQKGAITATPHPDDAVDRPKGYTVKLVLKPDRTDLAEEFQQALMDVEPSKLTVQLEGVTEPLAELPVSVSKVPYPGEQNVAELGVKPEGHDQLHPHF